MAIFVPYAGYRRVPRSYYSGGFRPRRFRRAARRAGTSYGYAARMAAYPFRRSRVPSFRSRYW